MPTEGNACIFAAGPDATTRQISNPLRKFSREAVDRPCAGDARGILGRVEVGEVLLIDDAITGFDRNKPSRPCMVVCVDLPPRAGAWVVPGSTQGSIGTRVPRNVLPGLNKDGRFQFPAAEGGCLRPRRLP